MSDQEGSRPVLDASEWYYDVSEALEFRGK
jgi:hypothetical protein